jgi:hypothetical protein
MLPDADYPKSWLGHQLGSVSKELNRLFGTAALCIPC